MNKKISFSGISSVALHTADNDNDTYAHITPIYATSTFVFDSAQEGMERFTGERKDKIYTRWGNPSFNAAEETIAALEAFGLKDTQENNLQLKALLHSSGQAAMTTMFFSNLKTGDVVLSHYSLYGGTYELMYKVLAQMGVQIIIIDMRNLNLVEETIKKNSSIKLIHIETPANPTIQCIDIEAVTNIAKQHQIIVTVDNTFASPYLQQPFKYGVDFVIHSTTKFLNGHGTAVGGVLIGKDIELMKTKVWKWYALLGGNASAFDAYLLSSGMKTLELRMERHCSNAMQVANFLQQHKAVAHVNYNGLKEHPDFLISQKQMKQPGAVMSFELKEGLNAGKKFIDSLNMCTRAVSLGTVDTLVSHPASMTHVSVPKEEKLKYGITDGLIRMSVGIENIDDILNDLSQALHQCF
ncbi:MAG: aminotransferase class I/II-fold pyridoxal phosphate-dependent enzyme [Chitinophagaceae bacterium]|nr:aminotransferase class I/II-fold pyridoxal phosphate-dependent enzyme [Chitinophagaceae bacterium]MCW5904444.1 aminotransferase class I/II-fold pyridoxal phosphate-dependent enzyme [Chitinophagaceae bacterium]